MAEMPFLFGTEIFSQFFGLIKFSPLNTRKFIPIKIQNISYIGFYQKPNKIGIGKGFKIV